MGFVFPNTPWKSLSLVLQTLYTITKRKEALAKKIGLEKMLCHKVFVKLLVGPSEKGVR